MTLREEIDEQASSWAKEEFFRLVNVDSSMQDVVKALLDTREQLTKEDKNQNYFDFLKYYRLEELLDRLLTFKHLEKAGRPDLVRKWEKEEGWI